MAFVPTSSAVHKINGVDFKGRNNICMLIRSKIPMRFCNKNVFKSWGPELEIRLKAWPKNKVEQQLSFKQLSAAVPDSSREHKINDLDLLRTKSN